MKKVLTSIVVILIFVIVLFILNSRSGIAPIVTNSPILTSSPTPTQAPANKSEVIISQIGLSQSNLVIKVGDTVLFRNTDSAWHWPASGTHPTHLGCPGFDALRGLKQNESFSFTFKKATVCFFHDHLHAGDVKYNGKITVAE